MKLLFDENLSRKLVSLLADVYPDSTHVALVGLERADDAVVRAHAIEHGYVIASKDEDFHQVALLHGPPPKVIWVRLGNCATSRVQQALRENREEIERFVADEAASFLALG